MIYFILSLILALSSSIGFAEENLPSYNLSVSFDLNKSTVNGKAVISVQNEKDLLISFGNLRIISVKIDGQVVPDYMNLKTITLKGKKSAEIIYNAYFPDEQENSNLQNSGIVSSNIITEKGVSLTRMWYPVFDGMAYFNLKAEVPEGFTAISEAEEIEVKNIDSGKEYSFHFLHPLNEITFVAARYSEFKEKIENVQIYAYFFPEDEKLANTYIEYSKKFIRMYRNLLGEYPYKRFSIVENFQSTGYSMPTFTLLGQDVIRLPFIAETALGHEILHQWFGNYVYIDYKKGNWAEGLTAYLSDHLYEEQKGKGWQYRKNIISDYLSYVDPQKEITLREFTSRTDFATKAIGYGKASMVFHMLKNLVGEELFFKTLKAIINEKSFQNVSWDEIKILFEKYYGKELDSFFSQWLDRKGLPFFEINALSVKILDGKPAVNFNIVQKDEPYMIDIPVEIITTTGSFRKNLHIEKTRENFSIHIDGTPSELVIDPDYDVLRKISENEIPPLISRLIGDNKKLIVIPDIGKEKYENLIDIFKEQNFSVKDEIDVNDEDIRTSSLLVFADEGRVIKRLFGSVKNFDRGFSLEIKKNPLNSEKVIGIAYADSKQEADSVSKKIFHYGKYSFIRFKDGKNIQKEIVETSRGIRFQLDISVKGIKPEKTLSIDEIIEQIKNKPVIYVGERHENYEDHKIQLKIIMGLYEKDRKIAIGMEMFQRPFQKALNDYLSGTINEKQFLKSTEYYKRWQFDYNLYREIIEYAKAKKIPVIALNQWTEIIKKVSREGIDGLDFVEKREIPENMDMSDENYKSILKEVFSSHRNHESRNFEYFIQSQILWDETMAHSAAEFMTKNPDYQMVILAGVGHIMYGAGIPNRLKRINGKDYVTLIPVSENTDKNIADYILFPEQLPAPSTLKLGLILKETESGVKVEDIIPGSRVKNSGLKKGDILFSLDDWKIEDINDIKIFMFDKKEGDTIKIKAKRKKFLSGYQLLEFTAVL